MSSLGRSSFLSPEHQEGGGGALSWLVVKSSLKVLFRTNRGKRQEGKDRGCGLGVREPSVVMAPVSLHGPAWSCPFT